MVSFLPYPGAVDFDKKIPENVMNVQSNCFVALVVIVAFTRYFLARVAKLTKLHKKLENVNFRR